MMETMLEIESLYFSFAAAGTESLNSSLALYLDSHKNMRTQNLNTL